jgi:protein SCO1/2
VGKVLSPRPGVPVKADELLRQHARLRDGEYACVVTEAQMPMPEWPLLMNGVKVPVAELDSFGTAFEPGEDLYLKVMEYDTRAIKQCIQPDTQSVILDAATADVVVPHIGGRFVLIDHEGRLVTPEQMKGKYALIYFGYTYCPDVCPTSLQVMSAALKKLGPLADRIQPWFITVDPERDTQEVLAGYVGYFDKRLIGLTGSKAMIHRVLQEFGVTAEKVPDKGGDPKKYLIDHSASLYLMAPDGRYITQFAHGITPDQLAQKLKQYVH